MIVDTTAAESPKDTAAASLTDLLCGILKNDCDLDEARTEWLKQKYGISD